MKKGDLCFFYHSNIYVIVGIKITEAIADETIKKEICSCSS